MRLPCTEILLIWARMALLLPPKFFRSPQVQSPVLNCPHGLNPLKAEKTLQALFHKLCGDL